MKISIARLMSSCAAVLLLSAVGLSWWMSSQVNRLDEVGHDLHHIPRLWPGAEGRLQVADAVQSSIERGLIAGVPFGDAGQQLRCAVGNGGNVPAGLVQG